MAVDADPNNVKVYTVNGAASGSSSSIPDWLTRKRVAKKGKRAIKEHVENTIDLIQEFEFPEASNRIRSTREGHHVIATGTYKPQMRVYDLDQLTLKFERHTDAENVDFVILSDDWTKTLHLQNDRSIEVHNQGGFYYRTRIPKFGRALAYHFPSCDALIAASGPEVYRLNLSQGRFLNPLVLQGDSGDNVEGVNCIDVNPAHQLLGFGVDGNGTVEFWDPRSRTRAGLLRLPYRELVSSTTRSFALPGVADAGALPSLSVTAMASRSDGLSYAVGTSTGHTLLYDIRSPKPVATKDLGYGLPVKSVSWIEGGSKMAGDGLILSADRKVIKIWDRNNPSGNFASITPAADINHVHHLPGSGLIMLANEAIRMTTLYIPQLGPAPRWCSFLENITEEMEDQTMRSVYEDYKFVDRNELAKLGLEHVIGTPAAKPYMHGFFISLQLYDAARVISNPFVYAEHREKMVQDKLNKLSETRIRARKAANAPKVNKVMAERIQKDEERQRKREEKKRERKKDADTEGAGAAEPETGAKSKSNVLNDPRFKDLFENPEFEVDEESWEYQLLHPSESAQRKRQPADEDDDESDQMSSDGSENSESEGESDNDGSDSSQDSDSSREGDLGQFDPRHRSESDTQREQRAPVHRQVRKDVRMAPVRANAIGSAAGGHQPRDATFGQRRQTSTSRPKIREEKAPEGAVAVSYIPGSGSSSNAKHASDANPDDMLVPGGRGKQKQKKRPGVETFGAGLERGSGVREERPLEDQERKGRTKRRIGIRSGSKNAFRGT